MAMKYHILYAGMLLALLSVPALGQNSADFEAKYGPPIKAFEVRPGVLMTARYAADGRVCEMVLERQNTPGPSVKLTSILEERLVEELIDELVPVAERGERSRFYGLTLLSGRSGQTNYSYEKVTIALVGGSVLRAYPKTRTEVGVA
jgi:hypothetical protein